MRIWGAVECIALPTHAPFDASCPSHPRTKTNREPKGHAGDPSAASAAAARRRPGPLEALFGGWAVFWAQPVLLPSLALALLYLTCLSLGFLMTAFLRAQGMTEAALSLFRAGAAASGLLSTVAFPRLQRAAGLEAAGAAGVGWLNLCLWASAAPAAIAALAGVPLSSPAAGAGGGAGGGSAPGPLLLLLLCGLAASRFGVWLFDLAVSQMQQERVAPAELGAVSGVQAAVQSLCEILSFVAGALLHKPSQFPLLMLGSLGAISSAGVLFGADAWRQRRRRLEGGAGVGAAAAAAAAYTRVVDNDDAVLNSCLQSHWNSVRAQKIWVWWPLR